MTADDGMLPASALERLDALGRSLEAVARHLATVADQSRRTRHLTIGLAVSLVLDVVLTAVVTLLSVSALNQGATLHASQLTACAISNQTRSEQVQMWKYLFQLSGGVKNPQEQEFMTFVEKTFAPVNCAQVYKN